MNILRAFSNLFWLWTIAGVVWAWFLPEHFTWFITTKLGDLKLLDLGLGLIMLGMGVTLRLEDFKSVLSQPKLIVIGVVAQFVLMPFLGWAVATLFALPSMLAVGLILVSCCPGGTASNVICFLARANVALSVLMTMTSTMLAIVLTPLLTKFYAGKLLDVDEVAMIFSMVSIVLVPVLIGAVLNHVLRERLDVVKTLSPVVSILIIVWIVGGVVGLTKDAILEYKSTLLPAVFLLHAGGFLMAYVVARVAGLKDLDCRTLSIEVGMQNSGLGAGLARTHFSAVAATPCAISAVYHCLIGSLLAAYWRRQG